MKFIFPTVFLFITSVASAHGNLLQQAEGTTAACLQHMLKTEPKDLVRLFKSVHTEVTGVEVFSVVVALRDGRELAFEATGVDGDGPDEFTWSCIRVK